MTNTVISGPTPLFQNLPIQSQFYVPSVFTIAAIDLGTTTTVTTSVDHNYVIGQQIRLLIPSKYGSRGLNERSGLVILIPAPNQVTIDISSIGIDPFIAAPTFLPFQQRTLAQIIAIGNNNSGAINATGRDNQSTFIAGSFINISPL